jgi:uncharacterized protein with PIN domain
VRFVVDGMLGSLARWLRMLGYVAEYESNADDSDLLRSSEKLETVLLTRDEELYNRALSKRIRSVLILGSTEEARLGLLAKTLGISLEIDMASTKCPECGSELHEISKVDAAGAVPDKSLDLYDRFWRCTNSICGKTYWVGSHWKQIRHTLEEARKIASEDKEMKC